MRALKVLVVVMGLLIVVGVITLAMVIAQRLGGATTARISERTLTLPAGGRVIGAAPGDGMLAVHRNARRNRADRTLRLILGKIRGCDCNCPCSPQIGDRCTRSSRPASAKISGLRRELDRHGRFCQCARR